MPPWGQRSNWWKGQPVRSHIQISLRTSEATCQLLPIVGLVIEMWTVVHMEYDWGRRIFIFFPRTGGEIRICWKTNSGLWPLLDSVHSCYVHWDTQLSLWIFVACSRDENNQNTLAFCCDVLSSGKRTVSYRRGELMWSDSNWQTLYFSNPQVQAMFKEGIAHYGLLGGSSAHIAVHPLSISCSSWLGSGEDHNSSQQGAYRGRGTTLSGVCAL